MKDNARSQSTYSFFKKMDDTVEKVIMSIQENHLYMKIADTFDNLDSGLKKRLGQLTGLMIIFLPLASCLILIGMNSCQRSQIEMKQNILKLSQNYSNKQKSLSHPSHNLISVTNITDQEMLMNILGKSSTTVGPSPSTFSVMEFVQNNVTKQITTTKARITFEKMSLNSLMKMIQNLSEKSNIHTIDIQIKKDNEKLLEGLFNIAHYSKITAPTNTDKKK